MISRQVIEFIFKVGLLKCFLSFKNIY